MENGKAAIARDLVHGYGFGSTEFHVLRAGEIVLPEWLHFFVRQATFRHEAKRNFTGTGGQQRVPATFVANTLIPSPPLPEQRRIVDLLTRAEGIVRLRREAAAKAAELIPAIFIDMFGDPLTNPKQLSIRKVEDVVAKFEGGKNIQAGDGEASNLRILKVSAVTSGTYVESECKPAPNDYVPPTQHFVRVGDMLFSRANTSELVGATALVEHTNGSTLLPDKLWRFVWKAEVDPFYMWALFQSKAVRQQLSKLASGTSDSMRNISQAKLFALDLPIAKLEDQRRFGELINSARSVQAQQQTAMMQAQATFNALVAQAFAPHGSLDTMKWRGDAHPDESVRSICACNANAIHCFA
jgi:type I restriction enzyme S subunit